jgi:hypothetical protein
VVVPDAALGDLKYLADDLVTLTGLSRSATARLLGVPASSSRARAVRRRTRGIPLLVRELVTGESGTRADRSASAVPTGVTTRGRPDLGSRLALVPERALRLLTMLAVCDESSSLPTVAEALGRSIAQVGRDAEAARRAGFLTVAPADRLQLAYPALREELLHQLTPSDRQLAHAALAAALRRQLPTTWRRTVELAEHVVAAGPLGDLRAASRYFTQAAEDAETARAHHEAAALYGRALSVRAAAGLPPDQEECRLRVSLGRLHRLLENPAYHDVLMAAAVVADHLGDQGLLVDIALAFDPEGAAPLTGRPDDATMAVMWRAVLSLPPGRDERAARLTAALAVKCMVLGQLAAAAGLSAAARARLPDVVAPGVRGYVLLRAYWAENRPLNPRRPRALDELHEISVASRDGVLESAMRSLRADLLVEEVRVDDAEAELLQVDSAAELARQDPQAWRIPLKPAGLAHLRGDLDSAERFAALAIDLGRGLDVPTGRGLWTGLISLILSDRGRANEVADVVVTCADELSTYPIWPAVAASLCARTGRTAAAAALLDQMSRHDLEDVPRTMLWLTTMINAGQAAAILGRRRIVVAAWHHLLPHSGRLDWFGAGSFGPVDLTLARLAAADGRPGRARRLARRAVRTARAAGALTYEIHGMALLARLEPDPQAAARIDRQARLIADGAGLPTVVTAEAGSP